MGIFAKWQPRYASHGVATFPMNIDGRGKRPAVRNWQRVGRKGSEQLAFKFVDSDSFAFCAGRRSGITVVDVDHSDEDLLRETLLRYGETPIVIVSGSGNFHLWYRFNGEPRRVRPDADVPVDLLGFGPVVAPPSLGSIEPYGWLRGSLANLDRLPVARNIGAGAPLAGPRPLVRVGERNAALFEHLMREAPHVDDEETLLDVARMLGSEQFESPLPDAEIKKVVKSAWRYQTAGQNRFGAPATIRVSRATVEEHACQNSDALALLLLLKSQHEGLRHEFAVANGMAVMMGWTLRRFRAARAYLLEQDLLTCVHPGGRGPHDPARYSF